MKVAFTDVDQQSVNGRTARAVNRTTGEVHTVTIAGGEADFGQLTYQQAYEVYGVTASGNRVTQVLVKTETNEPEPDLEAPTSAPGGLTATAVSASRIDLSWNALSGATSYEYRIDSGSAVSVGPNTSAQATGLSADTQYSFQVRARNDAGAGPWSSVVQATTNEAYLPPTNGLVGLYVASEGTYQDTDGTIPAGTDDPVRRWADQSGSGSDWVSVGNTGTPTRGDAGDGTDAIIGMPSGSPFHTWDAPMSIKNDGCTIVMGIEIRGPASDGDGSLIVRGTGVNAPHNLLALYWTGTAIDARTGVGTSAVWIASAPASVDDRLVLAGVWDDKTVRLRINGSDADTATHDRTDSTPTMDGLRIWSTDGDTSGQDRYRGLHIAMAVYNRVLTPAELTEAEAWVADHANINL